MKTRNALVPTSSLQLYLLIWEDLVRFWRSPAMCFQPQVACSLSR